MRQAKPFVLAGLMALAATATAWAAPAQPAGAEDRSADAAAAPLALAGRFLRVDVPRVQAGRDVELRLMKGAAGAAGESLAWAAHPVEWMFIRTGATQQNFDDVPVAADNAEVIRFRIPVRGIALVGIDFEPRVIDAPAAALAAIARDRTNATEAAAALAALGERPIRIRIIDSQSLLVRAGEPGREEAMSPSGLKSGLKIEIRPLIEPATAGADGDMTIRIYAGGGSLKGGRFRATALATGAVHEVTVDEHGIGHFPFRERGGWRIDVRHVAPAIGAPADEEDDGAEWVLYTGTLTFRTDVAGDAPGPAAGEGGGR